MEKNEINEVDRHYTAILKEYYIDIPNFKSKVLGKVSRVTQEDHIIYHGEISHFFLPSAEAPFYVGEDDNILVRDEEQAHIRVKQLLEQFTPKFGTKKNKFYKS